MVGAMHMKTGLVGTKLTYFLRILPSKMPWIIMKCLWLRLERTSDFLSLKAQHQPEKAIWPPKEACSSSLLDCGQKVNGKVINYQRMESSQGDYSSQEQNSHLIKEDSPLQETEPTQVVPGVSELLQTSRLIAVILSFSQPWVYIVPMWG